MTGRGPGRVRGHDNGHGHSQHHGHGCSRGRGHSRGHSHGHGDGAELSFCGYQLSPSSFVRGDERGDFATHSGSQEGRRATPHPTFTYKNQSRNKYVVLYYYII